MEYKAALRIAELVKAKLQPFCTRIEIAGSIRRKKSDVKDIEIVAIPLPWQVGLFLDGIGEVISQWEKVKGDVENETYPEVKYTQRILPEGIKLDLFFAHPDNWGYIYAIRTGSSDYSRKVLAAGWVAKGYKGIDGNLTYKGREIPIREEIDLFRKLEMNFVEPENRNL